MILTAEISQVQRRHLESGGVLEAGTLFTTWNYRVFYHQSLEGLFFQMTLTDFEACFEKRQDEKGLDVYLSRQPLGLKRQKTAGTAAGKIVELAPGRIQILMNTSIIDDSWCFPALKKIISASDQVCILPFSFFNDTKNLSDWNKQYAPGQGIWYRANQDVFYKYGIQPSQIVWVNYFTDNRQQMLNAILNSSLILFTGGAPDLMMKRLKEKKLIRALKNYQGIVMGYSAGAMIQIDSYHISPDEDYPRYDRKPGLGYIHDFDVEVHYRGTNIQKESILRAQKEIPRPVYAIYELGGIIADSKGRISCFGQVDYF